MNRIFIPLRKKNCAQQKSVTEIMVEIRVENVLKPTQRKNMTVSQIENSMKQITDVLLFKRHKIKICGYFQRFCCQKHPYKRVGQFPSRL